MTEGDLKKNISNCSNLLFRGVMMMLLFSSLLKGE